MTPWSHGYVADALYTQSYQGAQVPAHLGLVAALNGVAWQPRPEMVVADIGCGRGYTLNAIAAANPGWRCLGLDYNPAHVAEAAELAAQADLGNAAFVEADLAAMDDAAIDRLPMLDVAMLHGVWSWVSDAVRAGIVRLLQRRLKPGGLAYVAYNALPGFGAEMALQRAVQLGARLQAGGDSAQRAVGAIPLLRELRAAQARHLPETPLLSRLLAEAGPPEAAYLAHEFLTDHWRPVFHADLCAALAPARLEFIGSATLQENMPDLLFAPAQRALWERMPDAAARELVKDLCLARPFRRDVFVRGARPALAAALDGIVLGLAAHRGRDTLPPLPTPAGAAEMAPEMAAPILAALAEGPLSLGELRRLPQGRQPNAAELLVMLEATGTCLPVWNALAPGEAARRFNRAAAQAYAANGLGTARLALASPGIGAGLPCSALELALATQPDIATPEPPDAATLAQRLLPELAADAVEPVCRAITETLVERLPVWRRFGVI